MNINFTRLVLAPILFTYVLTLSAVVKYNQIIPIFTAIVLIEHLYNWSLALDGSSPKDFRAFVADEYSKYWYAGISIVICIAASLLWEWLQYWSFFAFGLNFVFWRLVAQAGIDVLEKAAPNPSNSTQFDYDPWRKNIQALEDILYHLDDCDDKIKLLDRAKYSSFMRTSKASVEIQRLKSMIDLNKPQQGITDFMKRL